MTNLLPWVQTHFITTEQVKSIAQLCQPIEKLYQINHLTFVRFFRDGNFILLSNRPDTVEYFFRNQFPIVPKFCTPIQSKRTWRMVPESEVFVEIYRFYRSHFNIGNLTALFDIHSHWIDFFGFGSPHHPSLAIDLFLNKKESFERFSNEFRDKIESTLNKLKVNQGYLPVSMRPGTQDLFEYAISQKGPKKPLTPREMSILKHLSFGQTNQEIANELHLSRRTVESYIETLKNKLGVEKKSQILRAAQVYESLT